MLLSRVSKLLSPVLSRSNHTITLFPGDGIGPQISESVKEIFSAAEVPVEWEEHEVYPILGLSVVFYFAGAGSKFNCFRPQLLPFRGTGGNRNRYYFA